MRSALARRENGKEEEEEGGAVREGWHEEGNGGRSVEIQDNETHFKYLTQASAGSVFRRGRGSPRAE